MAKDDFSSNYSLRIPQSQAEIAYWNHGNSSASSIGLEREIADCIFKERFWFYNQFLVLSSTKPKCTGQNLQDLHMKAGEICEVFKIRFNFVIIMSFDCFISIPSPNWSYWISIRLLLNDNATSPSQLSSLETFSGIISNHYSCICLVGTKEMYEIYDIIGGA